MAIHPTSPHPSTPPPAAAAPPPPPQLQFLPPHISFEDLNCAFVNTVPTTDGRPQLSIPLDGDLPVRTRPAGGVTTVTITKKLATTTGAPQKRARDSLHRRDLLLKGKEGSRRRQRWENDRMLHNPHIAPPTPADFLPCPTHTKKVIHYDLACLWEGRMANRAAQRCQRNYGGRDPQIPRELKEKLKRARGAVGLVKMLEERVRDFLIENMNLTAVTVAAAMEVSEGPKTDIISPSLASDKATLTPSAANTGENSDEEDKEQIVFKPKQHQHQPQHPLHSLPLRPKSQPPPPSSPPQSPPSQDLLPTSHLPTSLPVYSSPPTDPTSPFARWLVHSIAEYYGLKSWSETMPGDGERVAYIGHHRHHLGGKGGGKKKQEKEGNAQAHLPVLPRPLWVML